MALLRDRLSSLGLTVSATTRAPREGEQNGVAYYFMSDDEFDRHVENGDFLEWAWVHGHRYGTLRQEVERVVSSGRSVVLEIDVQGGISVREAIPDAVLVFIEPPSMEELERRLRGRGTEDERSIETRLANARTEMGYAECYDACVVNDDLEHACEELQRVIPVVKALASRGFVVSVDTSKALVMREALDAGASILNDVRSFEEEGALDVAANSSAGLVIMHMCGTPKTGFGQMNDDGYLEEIEDYLKRRQNALKALGVSSDRICWDAGFGFGKTVRQNFGILANTQKFVQSGQPYLVGLSRKSSLGTVTGIDNPSERVSASVAGALLAAERGAQIVRVHDVKQTRQALDVWQALCQAV